MRDHENGEHVVGRYVLHERIAAGGMATVHLGRLAGEAGFARTVAIKRLHPHLLADPAFADMFVDEARVAARIRHPNVVPTVDVVCADDELLLVLEYIDGESLAHLSRAAGGRVPLPIAIAIVSEILHGLHAAHEARDENGEPLCVVHRDVSPQNVLVGADGVARLVDFGIARATGRTAATADGDIKGKLAYMAPEQVRREPITRRTDIYAAGIVLWELLTGERLFASSNEGATLEKILVGWVPAPSSIVRDLPAELDRIVLRALDPLPSERFATAREMAVALEDAIPRALGRDVGAWVEQVAHASLAARRALVQRIERNASTTDAPRNEDEVTSPIAFVAQLHTVVIPTPTLPPPRRPRSMTRYMPVLAGITASMACALVIARPTSSGVRSVEVAPAHLAPPTPIMPAATPATTVAPPPPAPSPLPSPLSSPSPSSVTTSTRAFAVKRLSQRPARTPVPCTATVDPTTKKTVYRGDCE